MRRTPLVIVLVAFAAFLVFKAPGWLDKAPAQTYANPIAQPDSGGELGPITLARDARACATGITFGPDARYVVVTVLTSGPPAGPLQIEASAPGGYRASTAVPAGTPNNGQVVAKIDPARRETAEGTLCVTNGGRKLSLYGIAGGANPSVTTVDGKPQDNDLSVTLLVHPSRSFGDRFGAFIDHAAAFNPTAPWLLWIVLVLVVVGAPAAVGVALGRAVAEDEAEAEDEGEGEGEGENVPAAEAPQPPGDASARS